MKANKVLAMTLAMAMTAGMLAGCGSSEKEVKETKKVEDSASEGEQITLNYWTWFPSKDQIQETVDAFEKENPDIKINMTVMESKAFQEKVPLALSTEEDIDVIGVQPSAFAEEVQDYLANLDELMPEAAGEDWKDAYSEKCLEQGNQLTGGDTKMLVLTNSGSMVGFYNAALLKEIGAEVPKTFEEYKAVAEAFKEKYPDKYVSVFAGKDSWVVDEMMLTVLGQQGDYYNNLYLSCYTFSRIKHRTCLCCGDHCINCCIYYFIYSVKADIKERVGVENEKNKEDERKRF